MPLHVHQHVHEPDAARSEPQRAADVEVHVRQAREEEARRVQLRAVHDRHRLVHAQQLPRAAGKRCAQLREARDRALPVGRLVVRCEAHVDEVDGLARWCVVVYQRGEHH
jgi:hypothetical protein